MLSPDRMFALRSLAVVEPNCEPLPRHLMLTHSLCPDRTGPALAPKGKACVQACALQVLTYPLTLQFNQPSHAFPSAFDPHCLIALCSHTYFFNRPADSCSYSRARTLSPS